MSAKRVQEEKVPRTLTGATFLLADEGSAGGDRRGQWLKKKLETGIFEGKLLRVVFEKCAPRVGGKHNFAKKWKINDVLQKWKQNPSCNYEVYKHVGVMHAVVFTDGAQEAKNAQVMCQMQNFKGLKKRKISDRNGQKSDKSK